MSEPRERYDHNANNVSGTYPIDEDNDLVPIQLWREQQQQLTSLTVERDRYRLLLRFALRNCRRGVNYKGQFAWHMVSDLCGIGSRSAIDLCGELQIDPDAIVQQYDTDDLCYVQEQRP